MTREEALKRLKDQQEFDDIEYAHIGADQILIEFLYSIGEHEIVKEYSKIPKWYA
jgi:hypothetical protein